MKDEFSDLVNDNAGLKEKRSKYDKNYVRNGMEPVSKKLENFAAIF